MRLRALLPAMSLLAACDRQGPAPGPASWAPRPAPDLGAMVARVGEIPIFATEVAAQAGRSGATPRAALHELIAFHLLAERLRPRWPPTDESAPAAAASVLVQRLLEREFEATTRKEDLPDEELRKIYQQNIDTFVHPRLVEVALLGITWGRKATPEMIAQHRRDAAALKAAVDQKKGDPDELRAFAREETWRSKRVYFFRGFQGIDKPYSAKIGAEVQKLRKPGDTTPLIEEPGAIHLARFISDRPAENHAFEEVREELRTRYYPHWRQTKFLELVKTLAAGHEIEVYPNRIVSSQPGS